MNLPDDAMFTPYNAGSFGNFTSYSEEAEAMPMAAPGFTQPQPSPQGAASVRGVQEEAVDEGAPSTSAAASAPASVVAYNPNVQDIPNQAHAPSTGNGQPPMWPVPRQQPSPQQLQQLEQSLQQRQLSGRRRAEAVYDEQYDDEQEQERLVRLSALEARELQALLAAQRREKLRRAERPWFWRNAWNRRRDVVKLLMLAGVIVLALAVHAAVQHYIEDGTAEAPMWAEVAARVGYPVAAFFVVWVLKVAVTRPTDSSS